MPFASQRGHRVTLWYESVWEGLHGEGSKGRVYAWMMAKTSAWCVKINKKGKCDA